MSEKFGMFEHYNEFLDTVMGSIAEAGIEVEHYEMDHMCWRVATEAEYALYKIFLDQNADLLLEGPVKGRLIASYKLHQPLEYKGRKIDVIELPAPKEGSPYPLGREHVEFVVKDLLLESFMKKHSGLDWDDGSLHNNNNPTVGVKFSNGTAVKFHTKSLEDVIEEEKNFVMVRH